MSSNLLDLYEPGERSALTDYQKRDLLHAAYWLGIHLAKMVGCPRTTPADNHALELAFLEGFMINMELQSRGKQSVWVRGAVALDSIRLS